MALTQQSATTPDRGSVVSSSSSESQVSILKGQLAAALAERDYLKGKVTELRQESAKLRQESADLRRSLDEAESVIAGLRAQVATLEQQNAVSHSRLGEISDEIARRDADVMLGEAAAAADRRILDFIWPGVRSQSHSRIKTTINLVCFLDDMEDLTDSNAQRIPKRMKHAYGETFISEFRADSFAAEAAGIRARFDSIEGACSGFHVLLQNLKQFRVHHAHPSTLPLDVVIQRLTALGGYSEVVEELKELKPAVDAATATPPSSQHTSPDSY